MGWCHGGIIFEGELEKLRVDLDAYYGYINEVEEMKVITKRVVNKPEMLISLEQCEAFNALPEEGGLQDQTFVWLQAVAECRKVRSLMTAIRERNKQLNKGFSSK